MKKIIALIVSLTVMLALAACGGQTDAETNGSTEEQKVMETTDAAEDQRQEESVATTAAEETTSEQEVPQTTETAQTFDTSWATNDFEKQIGQPVFENWEVKEYVEGSSWTMFVKGVHYETVKEYAGSLQSYGFTVNIDENDGFDGLAYIYKADNASGYHCRLVFEAVSADGNGNFMLEISKGE